MSLGRERLAVYLAALQRDCRFSLRCRSLFVRHPGESRGDGIPLEFYDSLQKAGAGVDSDTDSDPEGRGGASTHPLAD